MKSMFTLLSLSLAFLIFAGCDRVRTSSISGIVRDAEDIDTLSECLVSEPQVDETTVTLTLEKQCFTAFAEQNKAENEDDTE